MQFRVSMSWFLIAALIPCFGQGDPAPPVKPEGIEGKWKVVKVVVGEKEEKENSTKEVEISKDTIRSTDKNDKEGPVKYRLDLKKNPPWIDLDESGKNMEGIFKLDKDKLTICIAEPGTDAKRPTKFGGTNLRLVTFERVNAK